MGALSVVDPNSFSNSNVCAVNSIHFDLYVNFESQILEGSVDISVTRKNPSARTVVLDSKSLLIKTVKNKITQEKLNYVIGDPVHSFGEKLEITLPEEADVEKFDIIIEYSTTPESEALTWLTPLQTSGKLSPFVFSHNEAIHARTMFPCQDTPSVKSTYTAKITVPAHLTALMSAIKEDEQLLSDTNQKCFKFCQNIPVPSYLIAIAVGALESRKIGPRSCIWAEKEYVDKAAFEFSETESMLKAAEDLLGPYVWEKYDLLVLPPAFSFGGMENPCLTFLTPTLLAGDRSLANVVIHEITHSWTGNLVTNKDFQHFWLNEGFTRFIDRKIYGNMYGAEAYRQFSAILGWKDLEYDVEELGKDNPLTKLVVDLKGVNPEDAFSAIPYEKGHTFLFYLEQLLGGPEIFDQFLRAYIEKFKYKSIDTNDWKSYLYEYFADKKNILDSVDWEAWLYSPGMPPIKPDYDATLQEKCVSLSKKWINTTNNFSGFTKADIDEMIPQQIMEFLSLLLKEKPLSEEQMKNLTEIYNFENNFNMEIRFKWLRLGLVAHWQPIVPHVEKVITEVGRMKFTVPLFTDLYNWKEMQQFAKSTFDKNRDKMMHSTVHAVEKVFKTSAS